MALEKFSNSALLNEKFSVFYRCVEDSNDAIMVTDPFGKLVYVNNAWQRIYGYSRQEALGQTPRLLRSRHQDDLFYQNLWQEIGDPKKGYWRGELVNQAKDGTEVPVLLSITPFRDQENRILGYMGIALDISEKKALELQVLRQDRLASIGLLASGLAHEIGTPMAVILGRAEYLLMTHEKDPNIKQSLGIIIGQIDRISKLMHSLLHLSRTETATNLQKVALKPVIDVVFEFVRQKAEKNGTTLKNEIDSSIVVDATFDRLQQVFLNLIMNAIHAIESAVQNGRSGPHSIRAEGRTDSKGISVRITDSGCGIPAKHMGDLFKPFFTTKDVGTGSGMGLAVSHQIIESFRGKIQVESSENVGTSFSILFPSPQTSSSVAKP